MSTDCSREKDRLRGDVSRVQTVVLRRSSNEFNAMRPVEGVWRVLSQDIVLFLDAGLVAG